MPEDLIKVGVTALDRAALAVTIGAALSWLWLLPQRDLHSRAASPGVTRILGLVLLLLALTASADLVMRSMVMGEVGLHGVWPVIPKVITHSQYGDLWSLRALVWLVLISAWLWVWRRAAPAFPAHLAVAVGGAATAFLVSSAGHAGDNGVFSLPNLVNWLHISAGCVWGGTVAVYAAVVLPALRLGKAPQPAIAGTAARLSTLAGTALAVVLVTGLYNAWHQMDTIVALWSTDYGRVLLVKLAGVAVMMAIGATNRFRLVPAVQRWANAPPGSPDEAGSDPGLPHPAQRFQRILRIDTLMFAFVLVCAALLGTQVPPRHDTHQHVMEAAPFNDIQSRIS